MRFKVTVEMEMSDEHAGVPTDDQIVDAIQLPMSEIGIDVVSVEREEA